jgi:cyclase
MLKVRVIPTLLYKDFTLVKGRAFDGERAVGSPIQAVQVYNLRNVDELCLFDIAATRDGRGPDFSLIDELADRCFMPLTVGGGVRTVEDVRGLLAVGADKVALNTAAIETPGLIRAASDRYGAQCIVAVVDTRADTRGHSTVWARCATTDTGMEPWRWAKELEALGAGEIVLQSADHDGLMDGYDVDTLARVCEAVSIPVIASGGAGTFEHMRVAIDTGGASAVAAASMFHFTQQTPAEAREYLGAHGIPTRV